MTDAHLATLVPWAKPDTRLFRAKGPAMDFGDLKLRASPWIALTIGLGWIVFAMLGNRGRFVWRDVYPGLLLLIASVVLFATLRWLNRPFPFERDASNDNTDTADGDRRS